MPQFDIFTFSSQLFWVFTCFWLLYAFISYYALPAVSVVLKTRNKKLAQPNDLVEGSALSATPLFPTKFAAIAKYTADQSSSLEAVSNVTRSLSFSSLVSKAKKESNVQVITNVKITTTV